MRQTRSLLARRTGSAAALGTEQTLDIGLNGRPCHAPLRRNDQLCVGHSTRLGGGQPFVGGIVGGKVKNFGHEAKVETYL